ncbi:MAG: CpcT/CpeT family chromophore lyase [Leptolyngbyaceae cyanobacterium]
MNSHDAFHLLGRTLAGTFQNRAQALADPAWYVHIRLWCYPTQLFPQDGITFLIEQASAAYRQDPYRQRLLQIRQEADTLSAEYHALKHPLAFQGATQMPEQLQKLSSEDVQPLVNSQLLVRVVSTSTSTRFEARQSPGERCQFTIDGEVKAVELAFDAIAPHHPNQQSAAFWMYDKGIDTATSKPTWGAIHGPFKLDKVADASAILPF